jgi:hypothetical protein
MLLVSTCWWLNHAAKAVIEMCHTIITPLDRPSNRTEVSSRPATISSLFRSRCEDKTLSVMTPVPKASTRKVNALLFCVGLPEDAIVAHIARQLFFRDGNPDRFVGSAAHAFPRDINRIDDIVGWQAHQSFRESSRTTGRRARNSTWLGRWVTNMMNRRELQNGVSKRVVRWWIGSRNEDVSQVCWMGGIAAGSSGRGDMGVVGGGGRCVVGYISTLKERARRIARESNAAAVVLQRQLRESHAATVLQRHPLSRRCQVRGRVERHC